MNQLPDAAKSGYDANRPLPASLVIDFVNGNRVARSFFAAKDIVSGFSAYFKSAPAEVDGIVIGPGAELPGFGDGDSVREYILQELNISVDDFQQITKSGLLGPGLYRQKDVINPLKGAFALTPSSDVADQDIIIPNLHKPNIRELFKLQLDAKTRRAEAVSIPGFTSNGTTAEGSKNLVSFGTFSANGQEVAAVALCTLNTPESDPLAVAELANNAAVLTKISQITEHSPINLPVLLADNGVDGQVNSLVPGVELSDLLNQPELNINTPSGRLLRLQIATSFLSGVDYLLQNGVAHQDLNTANVKVQLVDAQPQVGVVDFGAGKIFDSKNVSNPSVEKDIIQAMGITYTILTGDTFPVGGITDTTVYKDKLTSLGIDDFTAEDITNYYKDPTDVSYVVPQTMAMMMNPQGTANMCKQYLKP